MIEKIKNLFGKTIANTLKVFMFFLFVFGFSTFHLHAASSDWQDLGGGKVRLVANLDPITNKVSGVIEVNLEAGWSTYWRYPGSSGIPPRFDFSHSQAMRVGEVQFPTPKLITQEYGSYAGYKDKVLFPFEADMLATAGGELNLDLFIGVCERVCIPAQAELSIKTEKLLQSDPKAVQTVSFAKFSIPTKADADDIILDVKRTDQDTLYIKTRHKKSYGKPSLFIEGPNDWYLTPATLMSQGKDHAIFTLDISRVPKDVDVLTEKLRFTLATGSKGIEIQQ